MSKGSIIYEKLIAYAAEELSAAEAAGVEAHLARDPSAAATVARYRMVQATLRGDDSVAPPNEAVARARAIFEPARTAAAPRPSLVEHLERFVARLLYDSRAELALAGLRGSGAGFQMTYELPGDAELDLQAEPGDGADGAWRLLGQVASAGPRSKLRVSLCRAGSLVPIRTVEADDRGAFALRVEPGTYDLHIGMPTGAVVASDIRIA